MSFLLSDISLDQHRTCGAFRPFLPGPPELLLVTNCSVVGWELLSEHVHFQPPELFGLLLVGDLFPSNH